MTSSLIPKTCLQFQDYDLEQDEQGALIAEPMGKTETFCPRSLAALEAQEFRPTSLEPVWFSGNRQHIGPGRLGDAH
jgi:hypothetical protein